MTFTFPALFLAGLLTFLSPCVLPLIPIYLATLAGTTAVALREGAPGKRLFAATLAFALGLSVVFVALGLAASSVGRALSGHRALVMQLSGLAIFLAGLKLLGVLQIPGLDREVRPWLNKVKMGSGLLWPFLFGAAFGLGWSPCIGPVLAGVLAFASTAESSAKAALYLATYSLGLTLPLVIVSLMAPMALRLLDKAKRRLHTFEIVSGALLASMGILFITGNEQVIMGGAVAAKTPTTMVESNAKEVGPVTCGTGEPSKSASSTGRVSMPILEGGTPTVLEFVSEGCPICQRMHPIVAQAKIDCSRHGVSIQQIDVSTVTGRQAAARYGILGVPTFLFVNGAGNEVARLIGQQSLETLVQSLEILAGQKCDGFRPLENPSAAGS